MKERLQKFLAGAGVASRRRAEELITAGYVTVNGSVVTKMGTSVDPDHDAVTVNGRPVANVTAFTYIALNKPTGIVCSKIAQGRARTVYQLVPNSGKLAIAGRLDMESDGLIVLTNDGEFVNRLTHPRFRHEKEYLVTTVKPLDDASINRLRRGIRMTEGTAVVDHIEPAGRTTYRIVIHQGWNRQIRRMIGKVRNDVVRLTRVRLGKLALNELKTGEWREVRRTDIL
ncbi:MAG: pseudouridine synthase [Candidatus Kerfeldbacteria bacterium]